MASQKQTAESLDHLPRRSNIHYWKCDRPAAFHGLLRKTEPDQAAEIGRQLHAYLEDAFKSECEVRSTGQKGNHQTFLMKSEGRTYFVRLEDGPEGDRHLETESFLMEVLRNAGIPVPKVFWVDCSRKKHSCSIQVMEYFQSVDLGKYAREGILEVGAISESIGKYFAQWQKISGEGFGPLDLSRSCGESGLAAYHKTYSSYFLLHLDRHLAFLVAHDFFSTNEAGNVREAIRNHEELLKLEKGCLVHKDMALWNILGEPDRITAFIDWDDAILGDPMDDFSLLGCFYDGAFMEGLFKGYLSLRPLPRDWRRRFWLHMLRNMIVKAVVRAGSGYFTLKGDFFLSGSFPAGTDLKSFTKGRVQRALEGLAENANPGDM